MIPQISLALSQATTEELVEFSCFSVEASESWIKGSIGVFDSQVILLAIEISKKPSGPHSARPSKSTAFRDIATLSFLKPEAIVPRTKIQTLVDLPRHPRWIAIDFGKLLPRHAPDEGTNRTNYPEKPLNSPNEEDPRIQKLEKKTRLSHLHT
ncbi:MAG: hypothetical protein AB7T38_02080 [Nitrospirales bacterium]